MIADIVSPVPILNDILLDKLNGVMEIFQEDEENPWKFFAKTDKGIEERLGVLGIGGKKARILADMIQTIITGEKTTEYMGKKSTKKIELINISDNSRIYYIRHKKTSHFVRFLVFQKGDKLFFYF
jgi:hypothetical protein